MHYDPRHEPCAAIRETFEMRIPGNTGGAARGQDATPGIALGRRFAQE